MLDNTEQEDEIIEIENSEQEDEISVGIDDMEKPFNPKDINIIIEPKTIDHLVARLRHNEIDLNTEFQRKGNLWNANKQSRLIESILLRLPLPAFYFDASDDNNWLVVDGLQRLWCLKNFIVNSELTESKQKEDNPIELTGLEILTDLSNKGITYDKLNRTMQRRILETPITTYLIQPGTPKNVKYNIFNRINSGGLGLNAMEIRNALNQEKPSESLKSPALFLRELSEDSRFTKLLKVRNQRMEDRELLLRGISFILRPYTAYKKPQSSFLDVSMELLYGKSNEELQALSDGIIESILIQKELFGKHLFSRSITSGNRRLNSALFEVWVSETYRLSPTQRETLKQNKAQLVEDYKQLFKDEKFYKSVIVSTSGDAAVVSRFSSINQLIQKYI